MEHINPFPPLIFKENYEFFNNEHLSVVENILNNSNLNSHLESGNAKSSISNQLDAPHLLPEFKDFFDWLTKLGNEVIISNLNLSSHFSYFIGNSWVNRHGLGGRTLPHNHGLSVLSCVIYLKLPENSGYTEFQDTYFHCRSLHEQDDSLLKEWHEVKVKTNDILLFPGWLNHRSQPNKNIEDRYIISANFINFTHIPSINVGNLINLGKDK